MNAVKKRIKRFVFAASDCVVRIKSKIYNSCVESRDIMCYNKYIDLIVGADN